MKEVKGGSQGRKEVFHEIKINMRKQVAILKMKTLEGESWSIEEEESYRSFSLQVRNKAYILTSQILSKRGADLKCIISDK